MSKRKLSNSAHQPPKKRVHTALQHSAPMLSTEMAEVTDPDIKLLLVQNSSLSRALQVKNNRIRELESKLSLSEKNEERFNCTLSLVKEQWDSLFDNVCFLSKKIAECEESKEDSVHKGVPNGEPSGEEDFISMVLGHKPWGSGKNKEKEEEEDEAQKLLLKQKVEEAFTERASSFTEILVRICNGIQKQKQKNEELHSIIQNGDASKLREVVSADTRDLQTRIKTLEQSLDSLQFKNASLQEENARCKAGWVQAELNYKKKAEELDDVTSEVLTLRNRQLRFKEEKQQMENRAKSTQIMTENKGTLPVKTELPQSSGLPETEEIKALREEIGDLRETDKNRLDEINQLREDRASLLQKITTLNAQLASPPEQCILKSQAYQVLSQQYRMVHMDFENQAILINQLRHSLASANEQAREDLEKLKVAELDRRKKLEEELKEERANLVRVRNMRDSYQYKLAQKKAALPSSKVVAEFKLMIETLEKQNKKAQADIKHYQVDIEKLKQQIEDIQGDSKQLESNELKQVLQEQVKTLRAKLNDYRKKEKKWEESQRELKLLLEVYQGQDRDRREITEVRMSEKRVMEENKRLLSKLERYESEGKAYTPTPIPTPSPKPKPRILAQKEDNPSRDVNTTRSLAKADKTIRDLTHKLESEKQAGAELLGEIDTISQAFEDMQEQNTRLLHQLSEKDDSNTKLISHRIKSEQIQALTQQEKKALSQQLEITKSQLGIAKEQIEKEKEQRKLLEETLSKASEQLSQLNNAIEMHKRQNREQQEQLMDIRLKLEHTTNTLIAFKQSSEQMTLSLTNQEAKAMRIQEESNLLQRKMERMASRGTDLILEEELEQTKKLLRCPVCNDRKKDTVITRCFHVFCRPCIKQNLAVRHRKCPGCGKPFGEGDVHNLYLGFDDEVD